LVLASQISPVNEQSVPGLLPVAPQVVMLVGLTQTTTPASSSKSGNRGGAHVAEQAPPEHTRPSPQDEPPVQSAWMPQFRLSTSGSMQWGSAGLQAKRVASTSGSKPKQKFGTQ
jgi:hypothetical protein